jgi:hypothetical protein
MVDFYLRYKKPRNVMQMQSNYIKWVFSQKIRKHFQYLDLVIGLLRVQKDLKPVDLLMI